jgi:hypothetical protein
MDVSEELYASIFVVYVVTVEASSSEKSVNLPIDTSSYTRRLESDQHRFDYLKFRM